MAQVLHSFGIKNVVIKAGPEGCYASNKDVHELLPALPVPVVDTTGAGDHFVAGYIAGILEGKGFAGCCQKGLECAAECVRHAGATEPVPSD